MVCLHCNKEKKYHFCIDCSAEELFEERKRGYLSAINDIKLKLDLTPKQLNSLLVLEDLELKRITW